MKHKIGVCDVEPEFAFSFMEVVNARTTCPFEVQAFTSVDSLRKYLEHDHTDILMLSPEYCTEEIMELHPEHIYSVNDGHSVQEKEGIHQIYKYQRVDNMLKKILEEYTQYTGISGRTDRTTSVIGIFSPIHRVGKTTFALALGQELGKDSKVLYIGLEEFSGISETLAGTCELDLADVIYLSRQEGDMLANRLPCIVKNMRNMDYIPSAKIPLEVTDMDEDWRNFIFRIAELGSYEIILVDFGNSIRGVLEPLSRCDRIYMPVAEDAISNGKIRQYEDMLEQLDYTDIMNKTIKVALPEGNRFKDQTMVMGEFVWGPMAGFAKEVVREDELWMDKK